MVIKERLNYFFSVSFAVHLLILFLLSVFNTQSRRKELPLIEVSFIEAGGSPAAGKSTTAKPKMLPGVSYPFQMENASSSAGDPRREYTEPDYTPVSSVFSRKGDVSIAGAKKDSTPKATGLTSSLKRGPDFPSRAEVVSGFSGGKLGIAGPAATRGILYFEYPVYPEWAEKKGIASRVKLKFWISPNGYVEEIAVVQRGYLELDNLAVQSLKKWRFDPLSSRSGQIRQWGTIEMIFKLQ